MPKKKSSHSPGSKREGISSAHRANSEPNMRISHPTPPSTPPSSRKRLAQKLGLHADRKETAVVLKSPTHTEGTLFAKPSAKVIQRESSSQELYDPEAHGYDSMKIEHVIVHSGRAWRETLGLKAKFTSISQNKAENSSPVLRVFESFGLASQAKSTSKLYPLKTQLTHSLSKFFNQIIHPAYCSWMEDKPLRFRQELFLFIQGVIEDLVDFTRHECTFSPFEDNPQHYLESTFKNNQKALDNHLKQIKLTRAKGILSDFLNLIDVELSLDLIIPELNQHTQLELFECLHAKHMYNTALVANITEVVNQLIAVAPELQPSDQAKSISVVSEQSLKKLQRCLPAFILRASLGSFKCHLKEYIDINLKATELRLILDEMTQQVIDIQDKLHKSNLKSDSVNALLGNPQVLTVDGFRSIRLWIEQCLLKKCNQETKNNKMTSQGMTEVAGSVYTEIVSELNTRLSSKTLPEEFSLLVPRLPSSSHKTFYICEEWAKRVSDELDKVDISALLKNPDKTKVINEYVQQVVVGITNYFYTAAEDMVLAEYEDENLEDSDQSDLTLMALA